MVSKVSILNVKMGPSHRCQNSKNKFFPLSLEKNEPDGATKNVEYNTRVATFFSVHTTYQNGNTIPK
jgi:hypothetical protein